MVKRIVLLLSTLTLLMAACAPAATQAPMVESIAMPEQPALGAVPPRAPGEFEASPDAQQQSASAANRIVIKNARLEIVVDHPDQSLDTIGKMAEEMGGFVVNANLYQSYLDDGTEVPRASITIRVPVERLSEALDRIKGESDRLPLNETLESQDVTSDYTDLQSRLRNLEVYEAQLQELLDQALNTEDSLNVYNQLVQVREQIEVIEGQIKYYNESAKLSAVSVELIANAAVQPIRIGRWEPVGVAKNAIQLLIRTLQRLVDIALYLVLYILPVLVIIFLPIFVIILIIRRWRARRRNRLVAQQPNPPRANPDNSK